MNQFNLRNFLTENKLTSNSKELSELDVRTEPETETIYQVGLDFDTVLPGDPEYDNLEDMEHDQFLRMKDLENDIIYRYFSFDEVSKILYDVNKYELQDVLKELKKIHRKQGWI